MLKFAFVSRHVPTVSQIEMAGRAGIELIHVGDADAFGPLDINEIKAKANLEKGEYIVGYVVVHPAMAMKFVNHSHVGIFENANRAPEGAKPTFEAVALHLFALGEGNNGPEIQNYKTVR